MIVLSLYVVHIFMFSFQSPVHCICIMFYIVSLHLLQSLTLFLVSFQKNMLLGLCFLLKCALILLACFSTCTLFFFQEWDAVLLERERIVEFWCIYSVLHIKMTLRHARAGDSMELWHFWWYRETHFLRLCVCVCVCFKNGLFFHKQAYWHQNIVARRSIFERHAWVDEGWMVKLV